MLLTRLINKKVRNMTVVVHSFNVFYNLILPFDKELSALKFPRSSVFLWFYCLWIGQMMRIVYIPINTLFSWQDHFNHFHKSFVVTSILTVFLPDHISIWTIRTCSWQYAYTQLIWPSEYGFQVFGIFMMKNQSYYMLQHQFLTDVRRL